jgi:hypothetical protein
MSVFQKIPCIEAQEKGNSCLYPGILQSFRPDIYHHGKDIDQNDHKMETVQQYGSGIVSCIGEKE